MKRRTLLLAIAALGMLGLAIQGYTQTAGKTTEADGYGGPRRDMIYPADSVPKGVKKLWTANLGTGYSSFTPVGDVVYTMGNDGQNDHVFCLNVKDGSVKWDKSYPAGQKIGGYCSTHSTPAVDDKQVYTVSGQGDVFAWDAKTGEKKWGHSARDLGVKPPKWGFGNSPLVLGKAVICDLGKIIAFDKNTGKPIWTTQDFGSAYSSAVPFKVGSKQMLACFPAFGLVVLDAASGKVASRYPWETRFGVNAALPMVVTKTPGSATSLSNVAIFITSDYGKGCAMVKLSSGQAKAAWSNRDMASHFSSCVQENGFIYGFDGGANGKGQLRCLKAADGSVAWSEKSRDLGTGSLILVGKTLVVLGERGKLFFAPANASGFKASFSEQVLSGRCWTAPAYADGKLFMRNEAGNAVCVELE